MASVNSAAGVMGKMISIQRIAVAVAATGMTSADESRLFRFTIKHSVLLDGPHGSDRDALCVRLARICAGGAAEVGAYLPSTPYTSRYIEPGIICGRAFAGASAGGS